MPRRDSVSRAFGARAFIKGVVIAIIIMSPNTGISERVEWLPMSGFKGALEAQIVAIVDTVYLDSSIGTLDPCTVIKFIENQLQTSGVPVLPLTPFSDTSEAVQFLKCLRVKVLSPTVAIVTLQIRSLPGTVLVTLDVDQMVKLAREQDSSRTFQARTWAAERTISLRATADAAVGGEVRRAISAMAAEFITLYHSAHE